MVKYETKQSDTEIEGCLIALTAKGGYEGELDISELEEIDDVMRKIGSEHTGRRVRVDTTSFENHVSVTYVYQQTLLAKSMPNAEERLEVFTVLDEPWISIHTEVVELVEKDG